ncbi:hypothetical protein PHMEG_0008117 [Phytophthora megakarya]|uniref:Uncharacterized protein n=1 Tax=Phytophthora megakarya TaxID=4795 RepID=A0A225WLJ7_9STRA|nr:hypothetical protein PHMEG_0008117 [Phytophthora megakarya]
MRSSIETRNLLVGVQTGKTSCCKISDLRLLVQETAIKGGPDFCGDFWGAVPAYGSDQDFCFSVYKATSYWEQCMLYALGMMFVSTSESSSYVFPQLSLFVASNPQVISPIVKLKPYYTGEFSNRKMKFDVIRHRKARARKAQCDKLCK